MLQQYIQSLQYQIGVSLCLRRLAFASHTIKIINSFTFTVTTKIFHPTLSALSSPYICLFCYCHCLFSFCYITVLFLPLPVSFVLRSHAYQPFINRMVIGLCLFLTFQSNGIHIVSCMLFNCSQPTRNRWF